MSTATARAVNSAQLDLWCAQLAARRKLLRMSQRDLCALMGIRQARLSNWETCLEVPNVLSLMLWAQTLGRYLLMDDIPDESDEGVTR